MARMKVNKIREKLLINVGCLFDIPTASFIKGERGETIINGGIDSSTAIIGPGNSFKSAIATYLMLSAANTISASLPTYLHTYDTENNVKLNRLKKLATQFPYLPETILDDEEGIWDVTDKTQYFGDEWVTILREYANEKMKEDTIPWDGIQIQGKPYVDLLPSFMAVDSLSEFEPKTTADMVSKSKVEDGSTNTLFMKQSLFKTKFLSELPMISSKSNIRFFITAHLGKTVDMDANKYSKPTKTLQYLKDGENIKGVSAKFFFLVSTVWRTGSVSILKNPTTKAPEYPTLGGSDVETDLNLVKLQALRNKSGISGSILPLIVSQTDGLLSTMTEFHFIKTSNRFGLVGSDRNYANVFCQDIKLSRTTVRSKIEKEPKLRRAINITAELLQLKIYHPKLVELGIWCTADELYNDLIELGYDWDVLLQTRGWYTPNNYSEELPPYLSIMDLLNMRLKQYRPYWEENSDNKKTKKKDA